MKPICTSCQHCDATSDGVSFAQCHAREPVKIGERLSGNDRVRTSWQFCALQRSRSWPFDILMNQCGQRGRWFQPKQEAV